MILLIILLPNIFLYLKDGDLSSLLLSFLIVIYFYSTIKTTKYSFIFTLLLLLLPFYLFYIFFYGNFPSEQVWSIIYETNYREAESFLGDNFIFYILLYTFWFFLSIFFTWMDYKKPLIWSGRSRYVVLIIGTIYFLVMYFLNENIANKIDGNFEKDQNGFLVSESNQFINQVKNTYPIGIIPILKNWYSEQEKINQAFQKNIKFKFHAVNDNENKKIIVLVIGETSRANNWKMNGYSRNTTPLLSRQSNLVNFSNFLSISAETRTSIPMILTRKPAEQVYQFIFPEKSIISAFKEAGFLTYWISTQQKFGAFDTSTSVYAKEADHMLFLNKTSYTNKGETDEVILPELKKALESRGDKKFIVIHTLGSHYNYSHRYTKDFDVFRPSLNDIDHYSLQDKKNKTQLINSYDNSILYTDYVVNKIIETLKFKKNTESFLFYSSDHGEDLFDNDCDKSGHGNKTIYNYEIAAFAWYSDLYNQKSPEKISWLNKNKQRKINQTSIFPTLIDAANIKIPNDSLNKSILKDFKDYPRLVSGGVDFDKIQPVGICKEIQ